MLICEELELGLDQVKVEFPALDGKYINAFAITSEMGGSDGPVAWLITRVVAKLKMIATGGSSTIRGDHKTMPMVGAAARGNVDRRSSGPLGCASGVLPGGAGKGDP